ncbi:MAG: MlaD family protein [Gammaproteobacteria bacterium]
MAWRAFVRAAGAEYHHFLRSAEGLQARQSTVRHRGVVVGTVEDLELVPDLSRVIVHARMNRHAKQALNENTRFYIVSPRVGVEGISGLSTIVSGVYIEMDPAEGSKTQDAFVGMEEPPLLRPDTGGRSFTLSAPDLGSLTRGSSITYHDVSVGEVQGYSLSPDGQGVTVTAFIRAPYDRLVHPETRFWNAGGVDLTVGSQGLRVRANSLQQVISGGVAFETPAAALTMERPVRKARRSRCTTRSGTPLVSRAASKLSTLPGSAATFAASTPALPWSWRGCLSVPCVTRSSATSRARRR